MTSVVQTERESNNQNSLPTWMVILKTILYSRRLWLGNLFMMLVLIAFSMIPGLVIREFFDLLTGDAQAGLNLWTIIALLFASEIGTNLGIYGLIVTNTPFFMRSMTLLRKNLLKRQLAVFKEMFLKFHYLHCGSTI
jgi:ATP-binding cassette subfamily B protein